MGRFLHERFASITPYVPGEQPHDRTYVKLNANETSVPPSPMVREALSDQLVADLGRYADPHCLPLREAIARANDVDASCVFAGNGSDEVLGFLFLAFFGPGSKVCFPDVTYGFYRDYCSTFGIDAVEIPLADDFALDVDAFAESSRHVVIANPNSPTGLSVPSDQIARIADAHPDRLVIVDEAYVDYGGESCIGLVADRPNLIVVQTMSKSRNLAGAHIGYAIASAGIVSDVEKVKFSFNPFNLSAPTMAIGIAALADERYHQACVEAIVKTRESTKRRLAELGFEVTDSRTNFLLARHPRLSADRWNEILRRKGILARHYDTARLRDWLRVTVGTPGEMNAFLRATKEAIVDPCRQIEPSTQA